MLLDEVISFLGGFDKGYVLENPDKQVVSAKGVAEIAEVAGIEKLPQFFSLEINNKAGKFATRFANWYSAWNDTKLSAGKLSQIGTIAEQNTSSGSVAYFAIAEGVMRWDKSGMFKEGGGSCFYGGMSDSRSRLESIGTHSLLILRPGGGPGRAIAGNFNALGRAWLTPYKSSGIIVSNVYYRDESRKVLTDFCSLVSMAVGEEVVWSDIGFDASGVHVNGERGYLIKKKSSRLDPGSVSKRTDGSWRCTRCRNNGCSTHIYTKGGASLTYCKECGANCHKCGGGNVYRSMTYINGNDSGHWFCLSCASSVSTRSCKCGKVYESSAKACSCGHGG